jgi:hypothetical protein
MQATLGHCSALQGRHDTGRTKKFKVHTPAITMPPSLSSFCNNKKYEAESKDYGESTTTKETDNDGLTESQNKYSTYGN